MKKIAKIFGFHSLCWLFAIFAVLSCTSTADKKQPGRAAALSWQGQLENRLPYLGHRNWILIVDKAFPAQSTPGVEVIYTHQKLLPVLTHVLEEVEGASHVKPVVFTDRELQFITSEQVPLVEEYRDSLRFILKGRELNTLMHDSVFTKIDKAARLFNILVLKTDELIPYSSVFIQLDCGYWNARQEQALRRSMKP